MNMALVQLNSQHRFTLPRKLRKRFKIACGQKFILLPSGDDLIMKAVPSDVSMELDKIIRNFTFERKDRSKAEK